MRRRPIPPFLGVVVHQACSVRASSSTWRALTTLDTSAFNAVRSELTMAKLDTTRLRAPDTGLPKDPVFAAERSGEVDLDWLSSSPGLTAKMAARRTLPPADALLNATDVAATDVLAEHLKYHELLQLASEHHWPHLLPRAMLASDAPLPNVVYEDFMKALTFCSKQDTPDRQFALAPALVRTLLCRCAELLLVDADYFRTVRSFFHSLEQQQNVTNEAYSAFVLCCLAAERIDDALSLLNFMDTQRLVFEPEVFGLMMHPGISAYDLERREFHGKAKGLLLQRRLAVEMQADNTTSAIAVHAAFVMYSLTLKCAKKWDLIRSAITSGVRLAKRTIDLVAAALTKEDCKYVGPMTCKALCRAFAEHGRVDKVIATVLAVRRNELRRQTQQLMRTAFTADDEEELVKVCAARNPRQTARHEPLLRAVLRDDHEAPKRLTQPQFGADDDAVADNVSRLDHGRVDLRIPKRRRPTPPTAPAGPAPSSVPPRDTAVSSLPSATEVSIEATSVMDATHASSSAAELVASTAPSQAAPPSRASHSVKRKGGFRKKVGAAVPSVAMPRHMEGAAKVPEGRVAVLAPDAVAAMQSLRRLEAKDTQDDDHYAALAFNRGVAERAVAQSELASIQRRLYTAWMNPDLEFKSK